MENKLDKLFETLKITIDEGKNLSEITSLLECCSRLMVILINKEQKNQLSTVDLENSQKTIGNLIEKLKIISNELC